MANEATEHNLKVSGVCKRAIYTTATSNGLGYINALCQSDKFIDEKSTISSMVFYADTPKDVPQVYLAVHTCVKNIITAYHRQALVIDLVKLADQLDEGRNQLQPMYYDDGGMNVYNATVIAVTSFADSDRGDSALSQRQREHVKAFLIHMMHQGKSVILGVNSTKLTTVSAEWGLNFMSTLTELNVQMLKIPLKVKDSK